MSSEQEMRVKTEFVRHSAKGKQEVIHRWDCGAVKLMKEPLGWIWAESQPVSAWVGLSWFKPCQRCCPDLLTRDQGATQ